MYSALHNKNLTTKALKNRLRELFFPVYNILIPTGSGVDEKAILDIITSGKNTG